MAVLVGNGTATPVVGIETTVATIAPGAPLDNLSIYFVGGTGGGGGLLELALYATVGGFQTRVGQKKVVGTNTPSLIAWDTGAGPFSGGSGGSGSQGGSSGQEEIFNAGGTAYTVTVIDLSNVPAPAFMPRQPVSVTIAGVNQFDTVVDQNAGALLGPIVPTGSASLAVFNGYAQFMDVAVDQSALPKVTISVTADCGVGSVLGTIVDEITMMGSDTDIATVFRDLELPVATEYFVTITNESLQAMTATLTAVTHSLVVTAGGAVTLGGDVIGPSSANTVIKWDGVPLTLVGAGNFTTPVDAAIPIYNIGTNKWSALAMSGGATMTDLGVVTINPTSTITLGGDVTGPSGANTVGKWDNVPLLTGAVANSFDLGELTDAAIAIYDAGTGHWRQFVMSGDATMTNAGVVTVTGGGGGTLVGNAVGAIGSNTVQTFGIEPVNRNVLAAEFVPAAGEWYVGFSGLTGPVTLILPDTMPSGSRVTVKDEDGSLASQTITVTGSTGKTIDGLASFLMNGAAPGPFGSNTFIMNFHGPTEWQVI